MLIHTLYFEQASIIAAVVCSLIVAGLLTGIFIPHTAFFLDSLLRDVLMMVLMPIPIVGTVLLYLDIRRQAEGDERALRAGIDGLGAR